MDNIIILGNGEAPNPNLIDFDKNVYGLKGTFQGDPVEAYSNHIQSLESLQEDGQANGLEVTSQLKWIQGEEFNTLKSNLTQRNGQ